MEDTIVHFGEKPRAESVHRWQEAMDHANKAGMTKSAAVQMHF